MNTQILLEIIGYTGSFLVIVSMLMTSVVKLRVINMVGSIIFCAYALCIKSYPTAAMQVCLIAINIFSLYKLNNTKKEYTAVSVKADDGFLAHFLGENKNDIEKFFPDFSKLSESERIFLIVCAGVPAGVFAATENSTAGDGTISAVRDAELTVKIDYTIPAYRDCSAGKFMLSYLKNQGVKKLNVYTKVHEHEKYLRKMGFSFDSSENNFVKIL